LLGKRHRPGARPPRRRIDDVSRESKTHTMRARSPAGGCHPPKSNPLSPTRREGDRARDSHL
jgi:hypothetical protein